MKIIGKIVITIVLHVISLFMCNCSYFAIFLFTISLLFHLLIRFIELMVEYSDDSSPELG